MSAPNLTERQLTILRGLADGKPMRLIARELGRAVATLEPLRSRMLAQLGARNDAQAVDIGHRLGLLGKPVPMAAEPAYAPPLIRRVFDSPDVTAYRRAVLNEAMASLPRKAA